MQHVLVSQALDFRHQARRKHRVKTFRNASVQLATIRRQQPDRQHGVRRPFFVLAGEQRGQRPAGQPEHLQRTLDALPVAGLQACGSQRVDHRQFGVKSRPATFIRLAVELAP